jgi:hypothetical protein
MDEAEQQNGDYRQDHERKHSHAEIFQRGCDAFAQT